MRKHIPDNSMVIIITAKSDFSKTKLKNSEEIKKILSELIIAVYKCQDININIFNTFKNNDY